MLDLAKILARTRRGPGGCRIWTGAATGRGYPEAKENGRVVAVHRRVVEITTGRRLPPGGRVVAAHRPSCDTRCVAPDHVRRATQSENILEARRPRRAAT